MTKPAAYCVFPTRIEGVPNAGPITRILTASHARHGSQRRLTGCNRKTPRRWRGHPCHARGRCGRGQIG